MYFIRLDSVNLMFRARTYFLVLKEDIPARNVLLGVLSANV